LFQPEAPGDGDDVITGVAVEGEPSGTEEVAEVRAQADILIDDAEIVVEAEKAEV
jgi:hypothetical protein